MAGSFSGFWRSIKGKSVDRPNIDERQGKRDVGYLLHYCMNKDEVNNKYSSVPIRRCSKSRLFICRNNMLHIMKSS